MLKFTQFILRIWGIVFEKIHGQEVWGFLTGEEGQWTQKQGMQGGRRLVKILLIFF